MVEFSKIRPKDCVRQNIIIETIKPKEFWSFDSTNNCWENATGG